ncbi:MAG: T9SS C-terminal target domain-containing protein [Cytophagales bacterium]|nr:MAG: T9SS C-terminal target domain-containing protein [Cytophagales bacterium]
MTNFIIYSEQPFKKIIGLCCFLFLFAFGEVLGQAGFFGNPIGGVLALSINGGVTQNYRHGFDLSGIPLSSLTLTGGYIHTFKNGPGNICGGTMYYRIYKVGDTPGTYSSYALPFSSNNTFTTLANGGDITGSGVGDQRWGNNSGSINLLNGLGGGGYNLEFYYEATGGASGGCGTTFTYGTASVPFLFSLNVVYRTANGGDWDNGATWLGGSVPPIGEDVLLNHNVTLNQNAQVNDITISSGQILTSQAGQARELTISGTFTNNGTANTSFVPNSGKVIFANGTTAANAITFNNVDINTGSVDLTGDTVNGTLQINGGNVSSPPTYGTTSTLAYNVSGYNAFNEWTQNTTTGAGIPQNVLINSGSLSFNTATQYRYMRGIFTISPSTTFTLGALGGDLRIEGNFTNNGTFNANGRAVFFVGAGLQEITGNNTPFSYLILTKASGLVRLNDNISVTANVGNVLEFSGSALANVIELNGRILTLSGNGGDINLANNASITNSLGTFSPGFPSGLLLAGSKRIINGGTSKILTIGAQAGLRIMPTFTLSANPTGITTTTLNIFTTGGLDIRSPMSNTGTLNAFVVNFASNSFLITNQELVGTLFNNCSTNLSSTTDINVAYSTTTNGNITAGALLPAQLTSLTINHTGTPNNVVTLGSNVTVGSLILNVGILDISSRTLSISANGISAVAAGRMRTSTSSNLAMLGTLTNAFVMPDNIFESLPAVLQSFSLAIGDGNTLSLGNQNLSIAGTVTLTSGSLNLKGNNILLNTTGQVIENPSSGRIIRDATATNDTGTQGGYIEATGRTVNSGSGQIAGLGVFLSSTGSYNDLTVKRFHYTTSNGAGARISYGLSSASIGSNPTIIGFRNLLSIENPNGLTINQIYKWNSGTGWSSVSTANSGCFGGVAAFCTSAAQTSFSNWTLGDNLVALPVSLTKFEGQSINKTQARLTWQTATEINNKQFEVEKSIDGVSFEKIATIDGNGNSSVIRNYQTIDNNFIASAYYRLRQIDFNGTENMSQVIFIKNNNDKILVYPNPTSGEIFIQSNENKQSNLNWKLIDAQGKVILNGNDTLENVEKALSNQLRNQNKGMYMIEIQGSKEIYRQKLVVE